MVTKEETKKVARLARIKLSDSEVDHFTNQLSSIMNVIESLDSVSVEGIEPLRSVLDTSLILRTDVATSGSLENDLFKLVPNKDKDFVQNVNCYIVPKVIE